MPRSRKIQAQINNLNELAKRQKVHDGTRQSPSVHPSLPLGPSHTAQQVSSDAAVVDFGNKKMPEADNPVYDEDSDMADDMCLKEFQSTSLFQSAQPVDLLVAYLDFVRELPELIPSVRSRLQQQVKECLNIFQVLTKPTLNFDNLKQGGKETEILDELSLHLGSSL